MAVGVGFPLGVVSDTSRRAARTPQTSEKALPRRGRVSWVVEGSLSTANRAVVVPETSTLNAVSGGVMEPESGPPGQEWGLWAPAEHGV